MVGRQEYNLHMSERAVSYLRPVPNDARTQQPTFRFPTYGSLVIKPVEILPPTPIKKLELLEIPELIKEYARQEYEAKEFSEKELESPTFLIKSHERRDTSDHENGHAAVARRLGWDVTVISVIAEGNVLGFTRIVPDPTKSDEQIRREYMAICLGGLASESMMGQKDHRGCGSDISRAINTARQFSYIYGGSPFQLLEDAYQVAKSAVSEVGVTEMRGRSRFINRVGIAA